MNKPIIFYDDYCNETESYISKRLAKMNLSELRRSKHLTKKVMAELTGLSVKCIADIESENSGNPTFKNLLKYLDVLGYELYFQEKRDI